MKSNVRQALLDAFRNANDEYISGEKLAQQLGCSRTAIWKHIEELKKDGFQVEAVRKKGYLLKEPSHKLSADEIYLGLQTKKIGRTIHFHETVSSTQQIAKELALNGAEHGTIVVCDEQKEGRGRMVRKWHSPKGTGIWISIIIRPEIPLQKTPQLTLLTAVAVLQSIREETNLDVKIKWPNDLLVNGRKVCGILTELQAEENRVESVIIGIGINVNQNEDDFPSELQNKATSLKIEKNQKVNRASLIQKLLLQMELLLNRYLEEGFEPIKKMWETNAVSIGKSITARTLQGNYTGLALGINDEGVLLLQKSDGEIIEIYSADIEL